MSEHPEDTGPATRKGVVPLRVALLIGVVVVVVAALGLSTFISWGGSADTTTDEGSTSASSEPVKYGDPDKPCETVDRQLYEDVVGMKSEIQTSVPLPPGEDTGMMECDLVSGDRDGPIRDHHLVIQADLYEDAKEASIRYDEFLSRSSADPAEMKPQKGPWEQAVSYQNKDDDMHLLVVQDDNITLTFRQSVNPFDAIESKDAVGLMTDYTEQILTALRK